MNEENIRNSEIPENIEENGAATETVDTTYCEGSAEETVQKDFIDEFAPADIVIPNYNKEKELKKMKKASIRKKKNASQESVRRRNIITKVVSIACAILLTVLLVTVSTAVLSSVIVRVNTSEFAVKKAIKDYGPERLIVGDIKNYEKLGMNQSAENASMADVLRDNAVNPVTYADIKDEINDPKSTYPEFIAGVATDIIKYCVFDETYTQVTEEDIAGVIYKNSSKILAATGQELTESDCKKIAKNIVNSKEYKELLLDEIDSKKAKMDTDLYSVIFSFPVLVGLILAFALLIILIIIACKGYAYKIIGWSIAVAGLVSGVAGFVFKPDFNASTAFVTCVVDAFTAAFNKNSLIYGIVVIASGILVVIAGNAMKDNDFDDEDEYDEDDEYDEYQEFFEEEYDEEYDEEYEPEDDYIEEIEQVSTAL